MREQPTHRQRAPKARLAMIAGHFAGGLLGEEILASSKTLPARRLLMIERVLLSKHYHSLVQLRAYETPDALQPERAKFLD